MDENPWKTPRSAPRDGSLLRVWIDEGEGCNFEHPLDVVAVAGIGGLTTFRDDNGYVCGDVWRHADPKPMPPTPELLAQAQREFEEDDQ